MRLARVLPSRPAAGALLVALGVLAALLPSVLPRAGASLGELGIGVSRGTTVVVR